MYDFFFKFILTTAVMTAYTFILKVRTDSELIKHIKYSYKCESAIWWEELNTEHTLQELHIQMVHSSLL